MEAFHVYVVGAIHPAGDAVAKLAEAMASHYGLPADDLFGRLSRGRFRVKANVDRATADQYVKDLKGLGARVSIEAATPSNTTTPPPMRASTPALGVATRATTPPPIDPTAPPFGGADRRATTPPPIGALQSGLSAAFSGDLPAADMSAFDRLDSLALSSVDGKDDSNSSYDTSNAMFDAPAAPVTPPRAAQFAPPPESEGPELAASSATKPGKSGKSPRPVDTPVELFAPPDSEEAEVKMEIAADEIEHRARRRTPVSMQAYTPPSTNPPPLSSPLLRPSASSPVVQAPPAIVRPRGRLGPLGDERVRLAVGVLVAILLGFVPATLIASSMERSSKHTIDAKVEEQQDQVKDNLDEYAHLDAFRDRQLEQRKSDKHQAALLAMLVWAAVGGAIGYVWFKRVPWDKLDAA